MTQPYQDIAQNYNAVRQTLAQNVELVVVSKTHDAATIQRVYDLGQRVFGENKVQELIAKQAELPDDIRWHLIGHLQTNKVKQIAEFIDTIQSVDSERVLTEINKQAERYNRTIRVLLQVKIAEEETKYGLEIHETKELFHRYLAGDFPHVQIDGLMGMASFTQDQAQLHKEFSMMKHLYDHLSAQSALTTLSMGMSGDYQTAIKCGATSVRIGSAIFGARS